MIVVWFRSVKHHTYFGSLLRRRMCSFKSWLAEPLRVLATLNKFTVLSVLAGAFLLDGVLSIYFAVVGTVFYLLLKKI